jgi:hypothetical protein
MGPTLDEEEEHRAEQRGGSLSRVSTAEQAHTKSQKGAKPRCRFTAEY